MVIDMTFDNEIYKDKTTERFSDIESDQEKADSETSYVLVSNVSVKSDMDFQTCLYLTSSNAHASVDDYNFTTQMSKWGISGSAKERLAQRIADMVVLLIVAAHNIGVTDLRSYVKKSKYREEK